MIRLITLGSTDLRRPDGSVAEEVIRQPRRLALLVFLALESRHAFVRRDRVLATFWPDAPTEHGRRNLSQALHYLRQAIGSDAIVARGSDELRIDRTLLACDVCDFLDAADSDPAAAIRLFAGDFLPAFFVDRAPAFELWADTLRTELRRTASDCAWAAAEHACDTREWVTAATLARRAAELAGEDEPAIRRLMAFLAGLGDRAGALETFDALARRLSLEYEAEPSEATRRLAAEIRDREHATSPHLAPAIPDSVPGAPPPLLTASAPAEAQPPRQSRFRRHADRVRSVVVTAVLMAAFIGLWGLGDRTAPPAGELERATVLVEEARGVAPGASLVAELVRQLGGSSQIDVLVDGAPAQLRPDALDLALRTTFADSAPLRATVTLVDRASGKTVASSLFQGGPAAEPQLTALAAQITAFARRSVGEELERRRTELAGVSNDAVRDLRQAQRRRAAADSLIATGVAPVARVQLAGADSQLGRVEREARAWILPPLERAEVAYSSMWAYLFPPAESEPAARAAMVQGVAHAQRAIALDRSDARGYELRGLLRYFLWATTPADSAAAAAPLLEQARADLERATALSRDASRAWNYLSVILFQAGEFAQAYAAGRNALEADEFMQNTVANHVRLFWSALEVGDLGGARHWCSRIDQLAHTSGEGEHCTLVLAAWSPATLPLTDHQIDSLKASAAPDPAALPARLDALHAVILARTGRAAEARTLLAGVERAAARDANLMVDLAWAFSALGDHARARQLLRDFIAGNPLNRQGVARSSRFTTASAPVTASSTDPFRVASSRR